MTAKCSDGLKFSLFYPIKDREARDIKALRGLGCGEMFIFSSQ